MQEGVEVVLIPSERRLDSYRRNSLIVLLDMVRATGRMSFERGASRDFMTGPDFMADEMWTMLSDQSKWWINPRRYLKERYDMDPELAGDEMIYRLSDEFNPLYPKA